MSRSSSYTCAGAPGASRPAGQRGGPRRRVVVAGGAIALQALVAMAPGPGAAVAQPAAAPEESAQEAGGEEAAAGEGAGAVAGEGAGRQPRPWAKGVSMERQERARALYAQANALLHEYLLEEAMDKYREALAYWDHPAIHYHLARALDSLGRPLEADAHMGEALRYGEAAFMKGEFAQVVNFRKLLDQKLAEVVIRCEEEGVEVALDGKEVLAGPGMVARRVLPGEHLLVASKPGQAVATQQLALMRGRRTAVELETRQRWRPWEPWLVVGTGALMGLTGAVLQWHASDNIERFRRGFEERCPMGCPDGMYPELTALRRRGMWQNRAGVAAMATGGAVLVTGAILVMLNQSLSFRIDLSDRDTSLSVAPLVAPEGAGVRLDVDL